MKFFEHVKNLEELRKEYHSLAMQFHPDRGGETVVMQEINNLYEQLSFSLIGSNADFSESRKEWEAEVSEELRVKIERIIHLPNIEVEILGSWVWCSGQTFAARDVFKKEGFTFSHSKGAWYWHKGDYVKKSGILLSLDEIRKLWGQQKVESEPQEAVN